MTERPVDLSRVRRALQQLDRIAADHPELTAGAARWSDNLDAVEIIMAITPDKERQRKHRDKLRAQGYRHINTWVPERTMTLIEQLASEREGNRRQTIADVVCDAVTALQAEREVARRQGPAPAASNKADFERDAAAYQLRQRHPKWTLTEIAEALARQGFELVTKANISRAIKRHEKRLADGTAVPVIPAPVAVAGEHPAIIEFSRVYRQILEAEYGGKVEYGIGELRELLEPIARLT